VALGAGASGLWAAAEPGSVAGAASQKAGFGQGKPKRGGSAIIATLAEIDGFYPPTNHWDTNGFLYANTVYDPLMAVAADGTIAPYLCQSMTPNSTLDVWTMTLRPGIKFSDGTPLNSTVVKSNFVALSASTLTGAALKGLTTVDTPDAMTVVFTLDAPRPSFPAGLTTQIGFMVGQAMIDASSGSGAPTPVGTGPFIYESWQPNDHFTATRNPNYWRSGYPYLDKVTFKPIPDTTQREATLRTGGVDLILSTDADTINRFKGQSSYQMVDSLTKTIGEPTMAFVMLNTAVAPTDDLRIRQALAKGLNTAAIRKIFGGGYAKPINGLFLPGSPYYSNTGYPTYDVKGAKALVSAYKADHGTPSIELTTITDPRLYQVVQVIQQMWSQIGVKVTISTIQQATLITEFITGKYQAATSYQFGVVDPDLNYVWFSTTTVEPVGAIGLNFTRNDDPLVEAALQAGRVSPSTSVRATAYKKLNTRLAKDLPYLWLEQYPFTAVGDARIQNFANLTLPSGKAGYGFDEGIMFTSQMWMAG
jgi:peptide/nickel transport system substrate-binding protein